MQFIKNAPDVAYLDDILLNKETRRINLFPASFYTSIPRIHLRLWCVKQARYLIPTQELIGFLKYKIGKLKAIEIGSGNGDLGFHLGILETDNACQRQEADAFYKLIGQVPTNPRPSVQIVDAIEAVVQHKPDIVIGSWITHKYEEGIEGNIYGPDERNIVRLASTYINIGNIKVHSKNPILKMPHEESYYPWIVSRSQNPELDRVWIWSK